MSDDLKPESDQIVRAAAPSQGDKFYLRSALISQFHKVETLPPTEKNWPEYEWLRDLALRVRSDKGFSPWWPLGFASMFAGILLVMMVMHTRHTYFYQYPDNYLRIVQNIDLEHGSYVVQPVSMVMGREVVGPESEMHFRGHIPSFEAGHTLRWIRFDDFGSYQSVAAEDRGYDVLREDKPTFVNGQWHRMPILAPNCRPDWVNDHVVCEGGKAEW